MKTPIYNLYAPKRQVERYEDAQAPPSQQICSRVSTLEKVIFFIAGAILTAIFYRH